MRQHKIYPEIFPEAWASDWGEDEYGLWMAFTYKGVRQAFRWMEPGRFMMGSPEDEEGRYSDEVLHEVELTKGFWIADTACTQALWEVVMGDNPSNFKSEKRPVENVSWEDAQTFIEKMNGMKPELALRLPTEAEWEYACRAGTTTRYFFGNGITPKQVNFDSSETVEVKSLPCNAWGLYEMHGNVWEWCQDVWQARLPASLQKDPVSYAGEEQARKQRVVRGGSWLSNSRVCRSAYRSGFTPDFCDFVGCRLALGGCGACGGI